MKALKYGIQAALRRIFCIPCLLLALLFSSFHNHRTEPLLKSDSRDDDKFIVVLDAGHGGHDPGNLGNGYYEKNIALNIVLNAGKLLEKNPDIKVIYTRKDDTFVDLYVRGEIANKAGADLFVSVHCDSHTSQAHGAGTFVLGLHANKQNFEIAKKENSVIYLEDDYKERYSDYDINSPESVIGLTIMQEEFLDQSIALAKDIQDHFVKMDRVDRKVKQAGFIVLHQTVMPSVLVETGFLTNNKEGAYLNSKKGQEEMGEAIAKAILTYKKSAMANRADLNPVAMAEAPDPEQVAREDAADVADASKGSQGPEEVVVSALPERTENASPLENRGPAEKNETPAEVVVSARPKKPEDTGSTDRAPEITYKVQIMASAKDIPLRPASFNGLNRVTKEPFKNLYRYVYGSTSSLREAEMLKSNADIKGYPSSFIVVYRNGERITFKESKEFLSKQ